MEAILLTISGLGVSAALMWVVLEARQKVKDQHILTMKNVMCQEIVCPKCPYYIQSNQRCEASTSEEFVTTFTDCPEGRWKRTPLPVQ